ncbi:hypothetical protein K2P97_09745 [bacterium]|nr:hypothetical protein [bacterium]
MRSFVCFLIFYALTAPAIAEYRVFTLHIIDQKTQATRQVETTLDPDQYKSLYPIKPGEHISYIETWWCRGNTSHLKAHCDNPRLQPAIPPNPDQSPDLLTSQSPEVLK